MTSLSYILKTMVVLDIDNIDRSNFHTIMLTTLPLQFSLVFILGVTDYIFDTIQWKLFQMNAILRIDYLLVRSRQMAG